MRAALLILLAAGAALAEDIDTARTPSDTVPVASFPAVASAADSTAPADTLEAAATDSAAAPVSAIPLPAADAPDSAALELQEKTVRGRSTGTHRQKEVSRIRLGREALQKVAAAQGDPFKALSTLPGVSNQNDMSVRPFVRGGKAEETQVLWEGIPLLQPYHFASVYSIFNIEALEDMTLYSGGFPASAGNALSGAIFMRARPAPLDTMRLFADLSVLRGVAHAGVPIVKGRLGATYSYQAFWYDLAVDRGWDLVDIFSGDSAIGAEKRKFRQYMDLPNFRDHQFGLNWRGSQGLSAQYTGIDSRDVFTVRNTRSRHYVNDREVSPDRYEWVLHFGAPTDRRATRQSWDSLAIVSVDNAVHAAQFQWKPRARWQVDQAVAWQSQDWHVSFYDQEVWTDTVAPDGRYLGYRRPGPSEHRFELGNQTVDWKLDAKYSGDDHVIDLGFSQSIRSSDYRTRMPKPVYDIIVHGSVDALDGLGFFDADGFAIRRNDPLTNPNVNYLQQLPNLIRFDHEGRSAGNFIGAYASDAWSLSPRHRLTAGLRAETDTYASGLFFSPRLAWFQALGEKDELTLATGLYSQSDFPFHYRAVNPDLRSEKAFHANAEWTHAFSKAYRLELQIYQKNYYDLVAPRMVNTGRINWQSDVLAGIDSADFNALSAEAKRSAIAQFGERKLEYHNSGQGKAAGGEVSFFYDPNRVWNGWLSAEVGYSKRVDGNGDGAYDFRQSRPWAFNWVNYFHMPSNYELSLRGRYASGLPYTDYRAQGYDDGSIGGGFSDGDPNDSRNDTLFWVGRRNGERYSPYTRWDLRLSKEFAFFRRPMQSYFEIWNAFNTPNFLMSDSRTGRWKFVDLNYPVPILFLGLNYRW